MRSIERAAPADRTEISSLLEANDLPLDGLDLALPFAVVARERAAIIGAAAVEPYPPAGLLRSVCVSAAARGTGLGRALVEAAESMARKGGMTELYLLTETAADWFPRLGYAAVTRDRVPAALQASPEFMSACPVSATVMYKRLESSTESS